MAKMVPNYVIKKKGRSKWAEWSNGQVWKLEQGVDFEKDKVQNIISSGYQYAANKKNNVVFSYEKADMGKTLYIQFSKQDGAAKPVARKKK